MERIKQAFADVADALSAAGHRVCRALLKGFANWERFSPDPPSRLQYDSDLYCPETAAAARDALAGLGYESTWSGEKFPTDHLPALARKTGWQWRGDFFDPAIPISLELHFRLWMRRQRGLWAPGVEVSSGRGGWSGAWTGFRILRSIRRMLSATRRCICSAICCAAMCVQRISTSWLIFWTATPGTKIFGFVGAIYTASSCAVSKPCAFRLAEAWFECRMSPIARTEVDAMPAALQRWFDQCASSPAAAFFRPNKDELWLHFCLLDSMRKKWTVLRRRLVPTRLPGPLDSVFIPEARMTWRLRLLKRWQYGRYVRGRGWFHARARAVSRMLRIRLRYRSSVNRSLHARRPFSATRARAAGFARASWIRAASFTGSRGGTR